jgi:hypothetical protein
VRVLAQHRQFFAVHGFDAAPFRLAWFTHGDGADFPRWRPLRCRKYIYDSWSYQNPYMYTYRNVYTACTRCVHVHTRALEVAVYTVYTCIPSMRRSSGRRRPDWRLPPASEYSTTGPRPHPQYLTTSDRHLTEPLCRPWA